MPQPDFNMAGENWTKQYRLRPGVLWPVLEQLVERRDGTKVWKRARWPVSVSIAE